MCRTNIKFPTLQPLVTFSTKTHRKYGAGGRKCYRLVRHFPREISLPPTYNVVLLSRQLIEGSDFVAKHLYQIRRRKILFGPEVQHLKGFQCFLTRKRWCAFRHVCFLGVESLLDQHTRSSPGDILSEKF